MLQLEDVDTLKLGPWSVTIYNKSSFFTVVLAMEANFYKIIESKNLLKYSNISFIDRHSYNRTV